MWRHGESLELLLQCVPAASALPAHAGHSLRAVFSRRRRPAAPQAVTACGWRCSRGCLGGRAPPSCSTSLGTTRQGCCCRRATMPCPRCSWASESVGCCAAPAAGTSRPAALLALPAGARHRPAPACACSALSCCACCACCACGRGVDVMDLLVTLTTKQGVALLNSTQARGRRRPRRLPAARSLHLQPAWRTSCRDRAPLHAPLLCTYPKLPSQPTTTTTLQDYSFLETPELPVDTNSTIIPRRALPNTRIPAYLGDNLVWGAPPPRPGNATAEGGAGNASAAAAVPGLPAGITCEATKDGQGQNCGWVEAWDSCAVLAWPPAFPTVVPRPCLPSLPSPHALRSPPACPTLIRRLMAVYCCTGEEGVTPYIPGEWPPPAAPSPAAEVSIDAVHQLSPGTEGRRIGVRALGVPLPLPPMRWHRLPITWGAAVCRPPTGGERPTSQPPPAIAPPPAANASTQGEQQPPPESSSKKSSSTGIVAGAVAGAAVLAIAALAGFLLLRRKRRRRQRVDRAGGKGAALAESSTPRSSGSNGGRHAPFAEVPLGSAYQQQQGQLMEVLVPGTRQAHAQCTPPSCPPAPLTTPSRAPARSYFKISERGSTVGDGGVGGVSSLSSPPATSCWSIHRSWAPQACPSRGRRRHRALLGHRVGMHGCVGGWEGGVGGTAGGRAQRCCAAAGCHPCDAPSNLRRLRPLPQASLPTCPPRSRQAWG